MERVRFEEDRCKGCGVCVSVCPPRIIRLSDRLNRLGYRPAVVDDQEACTGCRRCALMCPDLVITVAGRAAPRGARAGAALA